MSLAAFTRFLIEKGASAEVIEAVVDYVTRDSVTVTRDKRDNVRDLARERQRRRRERIAAERENVTAKANDVAVARKDVTRDKRDTSSKDLFLSISKEESINESQKESEEAKKEKKKERVVNARARGTRMLAGAVLTDEYREAAVKLGASIEETPEMWAEHVDYWVAVPGDRGTKLDWLATWRNDVRRKLKMGKPNGQYRQASAGNTGKGLGFSGLAVQRARAAGGHN